MPPVRAADPERPHPRWPGTLAWFLGTTAVIALLLYAGPITPSPGESVPSIFMGAFLGALLTVLIRSGFQQRPHWDDETLPR